MGEAKQGCMECRHGKKALSQDPCHACFKNSIDHSIPFTYFDCDHRWIRYAKISYPVIDICTRCKVFKERRTHDST